MALDMNFVFNIKFHISGQVIFRWAFLIFAANHPLPHTEKDGPLRYDPSWHILPLHEGILPGRRHCPPPASRYTQAANDRENRMADSPGWRR
jgi:hypothetical protein